MLDEFSANGFDLTPEIDNFNGYEEFKIYVNGLEIREFEIIDFQMNYGKEERGFLSFADNLGIVELAPLTFGVLEILLIDKLKSKQSKKYIITKVETIRAKNNIINIDLEFEEMDTYKLKNSYVSKSFKNSSILEILEKIFQELEIEAEFNNKDKSLKYEYFVTPGNISVYDFISTQSKISDFDFFVDRMGWTFAPRDNFDFSKIKVLPEDAFSFTNKKPFWKILEYKGKISNITELRKCVNSSLTNPNIKDLKYDSNEITIKELYSSQKLNGHSGISEKEIPDILNNIGKKQINHTFYTPILGDDEDFREHIKKTQDISIAVQGVLGIRMYGVIRLDIPRAKVLKDSSLDSVFSGKFVVYKVIDKIMSGKYFQILHLRSSDFGEQKF